MFIHSKKYSMVLLCGALLSTVLLSYTMESATNTNLSNNAMQQPLQLLTAQQRVNIARLSSFEEIPYEIQQTMALEMLTDFFILPRLYVEEDDFIASARFGKEKIIAVPLGDGFTQINKAITTFSVDGTLRWGTGQLLCTLKENYYAIQKVAVNNDRVITKLSNRTAKIWNVHNGQLLHTLIEFWGYSSIAIIDDKVIATTTDETGMVWPLTIGLRASEFEDPNHALFWIKNTILPLQANLIARAYERTREGDQLMIYSGTQDALTWVTFPAHVRSYLLSRLNIELTDRAFGTFFIGNEDDNRDHIVALNMIIAWLTVITQVKTWPLYLEGCDVPEFKNPNHALYWIGKSICTFQADLIVRAYTQMQTNDIFIIKFCTFDAHTWVTFPAHVRQYLKDCLKIELKR